MTLLWVWIMLCQLKFHIIFASNIAFDTISNVALTNQYQRFSEDGLQNIRFLVEQDMDGWWFFCGDGRRFEAFEGWG